MGTSDLYHWVFQRIFIPYGPVSQLDIFREPSQLTCPLLDSLTSTTQRRSSGQPPHLKLARGPCAFGRLRRMQADDRRFRSTRGLRLPPPLRLRSTRVA